MIQHAMESGYRRGALGERIPSRHHKILSLQPRGETIFCGGVSSGRCCQSLLTFHMRAERSGTLDFEWTDQAGLRWSKQAELLVT